MWDGYKKIIQETKYKNIDIIVGGETLKKSLIVMRELYDNDNFYLIGIKIYQSNQETFDGYDYVLIDYPPNNKWNVFKLVNTIWFNINSYERRNA
ncbi:MAG: hypothetical protein EHU54_04755 [Spiroplasma sp. ald]